MLLGISGSAEFVNHLSEEVAGSHIDAALQVLVLAGKKYNRFIHSMHAVLEITISVFGPTSTQIN